MSKVIRVLVIDDSATVRRLVCQILQRDPAISIIGQASDPLEARDIIQKIPPDVITLDLEMPKMDGLTFLRHVMRERPMRVIVMSSLTGSGSRYALEALRLGAVDVLQKPANGTELKRLGDELIERVHIAASARLRQPAVLPTRPAVPASQPLPAGSFNPRTLILLGSSTGGIEALREVITSLPPGMPPIAIVQHIPAGFSRTFAERMKSDTGLDVLEASDGIELVPGRIVIAAGGYHLHLRKAGARYITRLDQSPPVWHQRPAVDILFRSVARLGDARHIIAGILTGMGQDGAEGLLALRQAGAKTFAQDEATSVVYGMPKVAWEKGAAEIQLPIERVASHLQDRSRRPEPTTAESKA